MWSGFNFNIINNIHYINIGFTHTYMERHNQLLILGTLCTIAVCSYLYIFQDKEQCPKDGEED
jgi:hypothetical protein